MVAPLLSSVSFASEWSVNGLPRLVLMTGQDKDRLSGPRLDEGLTQTAMFVAMEPQKPGNVIMED